MTHALLKNVHQIPILVAPHLQLVHSHYANVFKCEQRVQIGRYITNFVQVRPPSSTTTTTTSQEKSDTNNMYIKKYLVENA